MKDAFFMLFLFIPFVSFSQDNTIIPVESWQYEYIKKLQLRGYLLELNPTSLPYTTGEVRQELNQIEENSLAGPEKQWYTNLKSILQPREANEDSILVGGMFLAGARRSTSSRLDVLNPDGDGKPILPRGQLQGYIERKPFVGQAGITFDWFYDVDPIGLDLARRLYIRSEDVYAGYNTKYLSIYAGRFSNHWSMYHQQGAFLTNNPRSFDQVSIRFGSSKISFKSMLGELDNVGSDGNFTGDDFELGSVRRFLFLHRLDWSPIPRLKLSFIEGELYHSTHASISLRNLVPLHFLFFESSNSPRNFDSNLLIGGSIWYQMGKSTFYIQGMFDDLVVERRDELNETNELIPTTYTVTSSLTFSSVTDAMDLGVELDLVSTLSYRSNRFREQWTYAQRGLATNFSDYIRQRTFVTLYPKFADGLFLEPYLTLYYKGVGDFRRLRSTVTPDGEPINGILSGTVERTIRPGLKFRYHPSMTELWNTKNGLYLNWWISADLGINFIKNENNETGLESQRFIGLFQLFGKFSF